MQSITFFISYVFQTLDANVKGTRGDPRRYGRGRGRGGRGRAIPLTPPQQTATDTPKPGRGSRGRAMPPPDPQHVHIPDPKPGTSGTHSKSGRQIKKSKKYNRDEYEI